MLTALSFLSLMGIANFLGIADEAKDFYYCSDSAFFVVKEENGGSGDRWYTLQGTAETPQRGFSYAFRFISVAPPQAYAVISAGQPVTNGRGLPAIGTLAVKEKFRLADNIGLLHLRLEGLTAQPREITCDITPSKEQGRENGGQ